MLVDEKELERRFAELERRLRRVEEDLDDSTLSAADVKAIRDAEEDERHGRLVDANELARELGL